MGDLHLYQEDKVHTIEKQDTKILPVLFGTNLVHLLRFAYVSQYEDLPQIWKDPSCATK